MSSEPAKIVAGRILDLWWSADSETLFYQLPGQAWAYRVADREMRESPADEAAMTPQTVDLSCLPMNAVSVAVSPGGGTILYLMRVEATPTVPPAQSPFDLGETWRRGGDAELWVRAGGVSRRIGQLEDCVDDYLWADDESKVVITGITFVAPCQTAHAWLVDLSERSVSPLFPKDDFPSPIVICGISPDGGQLLYRSEESLFLLELDAHVTTMLEVPLGSSGQWIDDESLLISYQRQPGMPWALGVLSLDTSELVELVDPQQTPGLAGSWLLWARISPDRRWLAFAAGKRTHQMEGLWLMRLYIDR